VAVALKRYIRRLRCVNPSGAEEKFESYTGDIDMKAGHWASVRNGHSIIVQYWHPQSDKTESYLEMIVAGG
jgi:hypothetical protein